MEWFNINASAVIAASAALLAAIIAGSFALLGAIINNRANKQQRDELFQVEKWKSNRQLFIEKGEETIGLISSLLLEFSAVVNAAMLDTLSGQEGAISEKVMDRLKNTSSGIIINRLDTLVIAYFPELILFKDDIVKTHQSGFYKYLEYMSGQADMQDTSINLMECNVSLTEKAQKFKLEISRRISEVL